MPDKAERRPWQGTGALKSHLDDVDLTTITGAAVIPHPRVEQRRQAACPWVRAAARSRDPKVIAFIVENHPAWRCAAALRPVS